MAGVTWEKRKIDTKDGWVVGIAPIIISASRATDIPAYYADWFMERLKQGYIKWVNPFNHQVQYVSFAKTRLIVFWTKNPQPLLAYLPILDGMGLHYYFSYTLNDYEQEGFEPGVPPLDERIQTFQELSQLIGAEKVQWRFDPLLAGGSLTVERLLAKVAGVGRQIHKYTKKLIISFADIKHYAKVQKRMKALGQEIRELTDAEIAEVSEGIAALNRDWGLELATCAEAVDLSRFDIKHNRCIDGSLMLKLFPDDAVLNTFITGGQGSLLFPSEFDYSYLKDKGQRKTCGCMMSKDIGAYQTCRHGCIYCYALK